LIVDTSAPGFGVGEIRWRTWQWLPGTMGAFPRG
jgi:hypothetical protein